MHATLQPIYRVMVNAREVEVHAPWVSYTTITRLAGVVGRCLSVTYDHGTPQRPQGMLLPRHSVPVRSGMVFNVYDTTVA
jgi:hypothetical protein